MAHFLPNMLQVRGTPQEILMALTIIVVGVASLTSLVFKLLAVHRPGLSAAIAICAAFVLSPFGWPSLLIMALPFLVGFTIGRSTHISVNPLDIFNRRRLSPGDYYRHQESLSRIYRSWEFANLIESRNIDPSVRLHLRMEVLFANLYLRAPVFALVVSISFLWIWAQSNQGVGLSKDFRSLILLLSFPYGTMIGSLLTFIQGHPRMKVAGILFAPTLRSFFYSVLWSVWPAASVLLFFLILPAERLVSLMYRIPSAAMLLFSFVLLVQDVFVHRRKLVLFEDGIGVWNQRSVQGCRWEDVQHVTSRERVNRLSGIDRLLLFECKDGRRFAYPISILSVVDQDRVLIAVRRFARTKTVLDKSVF